MWILISDSGDPACIPLSQEEYAALQVYIQVIRPKLWPEPTDKVFTASYPSASKTGDLKFSTLWNISQKFSTKSGQKMSSRSYRASRITNSRKLGNNSVDKIRHLARYIFWVYKWNSCVSEFLYAYILCYVFHYIYYYILQNIFILIFAS